MNHGKVCVKVYGHVWPATEKLFAALLPLLPPSDAMDQEEMLELNKDLLLLTFEGLYFPLDDILEALTPHLTPESKGKLDYLDLDQWTLTRHTVEGRALRISSASLNNILDYSGH